MTSRFLKTVAVATAFSAVMAARAQEPKCRVPANECERSIRQMLSGRRYLGLDIVEIKPGLVIKSVRPDSPASRADFQEGDRLIAVNGKSMEKATAKVFKETLAEARQTGRLWIRDENPIHAEVPLEPFEICKFEMFPPLLCCYLSLPGGSKIGNLCYYGGVFNGIGELAAFGQCAEAVVVLARSFEVMGVHGKVGAGWGVLANPGKRLQPRAGRTPAR